MSDYADDGWFETLEDGTLRFYRPMRTPAGNLVYLLERSRLRVRFADGEDLVLTYTTDSARAKGLSGLLAADGAQFKTVCKRQARLLAA